jgi:hypothetical protein
MLFHYPRPEFREEFKRGMTRLAEVINTQSGIQASCWEDPSSGALVAVSTYESDDARESAFRAVAAANINFAYSEERESRPRERRVLHAMQSSAD